MKQLLTGVENAVKVYMGNVFRIMHQEKTKALVKVPFTLYPQKNKLNIIP